MQARFPVLYLQEGVVPAPHTSDLNTHSTHRHPPLYDPWIRHTHRTHCLDIVLGQITVRPTLFTTVAVLEAVVSSTTEPLKDLRRRATVILIGETQQHRVSTAATPQFFPVAVITPLLCQPITAATCRITCPLPCQLRRRILALLREVERRVGTAGVAAVLRGVPA